MNIGIVGGDGIPDKKFLQRFWIVGKIVNQRFDQETVIYLDFFIFSHRDFKFLVLEQILFLVKFVPPDITFVAFTVPSSGW